MIETLPRLFAIFAKEIPMPISKGLINRNIYLLLLPLAFLAFVPIGVLAQCTTTNGGNSACSAGNGGTNLGTITPTSSWQSAVTTTGTYNTYEFTLTAGQVIEFATCSGINMELTVFRYNGTSSSSITTYDANKDCPHCTPGCTPGADDEYGKYVAASTGIHRVRYSRHGDCATTTVAGKLFYRLETRSGCSANTYGTNLWNGYAYNGTNANMALNYNYGFMGTEPWNSLGVAFGEGPATGDCGSTCVDNFSTRWMMNRTYDGMYVFSTPGNDDGRRLSTNGGSTWNLFDAFSSGSGTTTIDPVKLVGNYNMVFDHREGSGAAGAYLTTCQMSAAGTTSVSGDATDPGSSAWNLYFYNAKSFNFYDYDFGGTNVSGSSTTTSATLNASWSGAPARVGTVCNVSMDGDFSAKAYLTRSFNKGVYSILSGGDDRARIRVNGGSWLNVTTSATQTISTDVAINGTTALEYHMYDTGSGATAVVTMTCQPASAGSLSNNQNCSGTGTITHTWTGGQGYYQLQSSTDMTTWTDVGIEYNTAATPNGSWALNPTTTAFYRVEVTSCSTIPVYSNITVIARTATLTGNLTIASNITLGGTLTIIGTFKVNSGVTLTVKPGCALVVNATDIIVQGTINGNGAGYGGGSGGAGGLAYASCSNDNNVAYVGGKGYGGSAATGTGGGLVGTNGGDANGRSRKCGGLFCSGNSDGYYGGGGGAGGGGGGSYAGAGGNNAYGAGGAYFNNGDNPTASTRGLGGSAGATQGTTTGTDISMGYGGGGGGGGGGGRNAGGAGGDGGDGGGSVSLIASGDLTVSGTIACNGTNGGTGGTGSAASDNQYDCSISNCGSCGTCGEETYIAASGAGGGAGGGSGGGIKLQAFGAMSVTGSLSAKGGNGGGDGYPSYTVATCLNSANDGAAGGGGRIKIFTNPCEGNVVTPSVSTVNGGTGNATGGNGTYNINIDHPSYSDPVAGTISTNQSVCNGGLPAAFTGTASTGGTNVYTYNWYSCTTCPTPVSGNSNPGTGWTSRGTNATGFTESTALTTTTKYVRRTTTGTCYEYSNIITVTVAADPTWATNTVSSSPICVGGTVTFSATIAGGLGGTVSWVRATSPGAAGTTVTSPDTPPTAATYYYRPKYTATVSGCNLADGTETSISVVSDPVWATNTVSPTSICNGGQVTFSASVSGGTGGTVSWVRATTPGGAGTAVTSPDVLSTGTYYYRPRYTNSISGCALADGTETPVSVVIDPVWATNTISASSICSGGSVTFSATVTGGVGGNVTWVRATTAGGAGTAVTSPDSPPGTGTFYYRPVYNATVSGCGPSAPVERTVTVVADPTWATNTISTSALCVGTTVTFSATTSGGTGGSVTWVRATSPGAAGTTVTSPDTPPSTGTFYYRPKYNATASGCNLADGTESSVSVVTTPTWATNTVSPTDICNGGQVTFSATVTGGTGGTVTWIRSTTAGGTGSVVTSPDSPTAGTFYYRPRYASTATGCTIADGTETQVNVLLDPVWATNTISASSICSGGSVTFSATVTGGVGGNVTWVRATTAGGAGTAVTSPDSPPGTGTFYYRPVYNATVSGCGPSAPVERTVTVVADPTWATNTISTSALCVGTTVTFSATTSGGTGGSVTWVRATSPGAAGTTVTSPDTPPSTGTFYYRPQYNATASGCNLADGTESSVSVVTTPTWATNTVSPTDICNGGQVTFSATVAGGTGGTVTWIRATTAGGAGTVVTSPNSPTAGTFYYRPRYTSTATGCTIADGTETQVNVLLDPVWASNTISANTICDGGSVTFSATVTGGVAGNVTWVRATTAGGAGIAATSPDSPPGTGTFYYRPVYNATVSGCGPNAPVERTVTVVAVPNWTANTISNNNICEGASVTFSATVSGGTAGTITWVRATTPGGAGVTVTSPNTPTAGTYYYRPQYASTANGCDLIDGTENTVVVSPATAWTTNIVSTDSICAGGAVTFSATVSGGSGGTISWIRATTPTGSGSVVTSPDVPSAGTHYYRPRYTSTVSGCALADGVATKVVVTNQPAWATSFITPTQNCAGGIVTFGATVSGGAGGTITWIRATTPGGTGIVVSSPDFPATSGTYYYRSRYTSSRGCSLADGAEQTVTIVIGLIPNPANPITGPSTVSFGQTPVTYSVAPSLNAVSYNWTVPAGATILSGQGTTSITVNFASAINGTVAVWPVNGYCIGNPDYHPITFSNLPLTWTGDVDNSWHVTGNWSNNTVPVATDDVLIPTGRPFYPSTYTATAVAKNLIIENGASVTLEPGNNIIVSGDVHVYTGGAIEVTSLAGLTPQLRVGGNWIFNGTFKASTGTVYLDGTAPQQISGITTFHNLQILNTTGVTITSGTTYVRGGLNLDEGVLSTNGRLTIKSDDLGTGWVNDFSAGMNGTLNGEIAVQRFFEASTLFTSFHYIGSPVSSPLVVSQLSELNLYGLNNAQVIPLPTCDPNAINSASPYGSLFEWREDASFRYGCYQAGWFVRSAGNMTDGRGYAAVVQRTSDFTVEVKGTATTGNVANNGLTNTNAIGNGWHMVSNPYPSPIEWNVPAGFIGAAHFWNASGSYTGTYQPILSNTGQLIPSMQGFFIQNSTSTPANFVLSNSDRRTGDPVFHRQASWYDHILNVDLAGNGFADKTVVYFGPNCSDVWDDMFDAQKKESRSNQPTLYTRIANYGKFVGINGLPTNDSRVVSVPMGMLVGTAGTYTFTFTDMATFAPSALIYLEDLKTGTLQNVRVTDTYTFTSTLADDPERFIIHFYPPATVSATDAGCEGNDGAIELGLGIYNLGGAVLVWDSYQLTDTTGAIVASGTNVNGDINLNNIVSGNYTLSFSIQGYSVSELISISAPAPVNADFSFGFNQAYTNAILTFINQSSNTTQYDWSFGDGNSSTLEQPTHIYNTPGLYDVMLNASSDDCADSYTAKVEVLEVTVGLPTDLQKEAITISSYQDIVSISFVNLNDPRVQVDIFDLAGRKIIETQSMETSQKRHEIKLSQVADGYYFVRVTGASSYADKKVFLTANR